MFLQTKGSYDFNFKSFSSYSEYMDHTIKESSTQTAIAFGFAVPGVAEFGFNYNSDKHTKSERKIRRASGKVSYVFFLFFFVASVKPSDFSKTEKKTFKDL